MFSREDIYDKSIFENTYGLVLAGGGGKGAFQAGVFKALFECGLDNNIDYISGTSVGALNMCLFVQKNKSLSENVWKNIKQSQFTKADPDYWDMKEGLFGREGLNKIIDDNIDFNDIINANQTLFATIAKYDKYGEGTPEAVYSILNGKKEEDIRKVLMATSAIPAIYEPVKIGENIYRDGGVVDNLPITPLYNLGVRNFIIISLSVNKKINTDKYGDANFIHIKPSHDLGDAIHGTMDFSRRGANIRFKLGYEDAIRTLKYLNSPELSMAGFEEVLNKQAELTYNNIIMEQKVDDAEVLISKDIKKIDKLLDKYSIS